MMRSFLIVLGFCLAGCSSGNSPPPPPPQGWQILYSSGLPPAPIPDADGGWHFDFPPAPGSVHYVTQPRGLINGGMMSASFVVTMSDGAQLFSVNGCQPNEGGAMRLYFQRAGDNLSGQGEYEFYRWWSRGIGLTTGEFTLAETVSPDRWTSVFGKSGDQAPGPFAVAVANAASVGMTFGGCFAGHGVYVANGTATFKLRSFQ